MRHVERLREIVAAGALVESRRRLIGVSGNVEADALKLGVILLAHRPHQRRLRGIINEVLQLVRICREVV